MFFQVIKCNVLCVT